MKAAAAVIAGALLLLWPAFVNGYPIMFSDTAGLEAMGIEPNMGWDKPWVYGPLTLLLHWRITLWGVAAAQAVAVSWLLWRVTLAVSAAWQFLVVCLLLAIGSAAPWFVPLVMPDIFAPVVVLCTFLLALNEGPRWRKAALVLLGAVALAVHLAHLIVGAACLVVVVLWRPRQLPITALPLALALAWLLASNTIGNGIVGVSPYGSVFALARLQADGPAADYLHHVCPDPAYRLCSWSDRLPKDSDAFLWEPEGPVWGNNSGPTLLAPEASRLVAATVRYEPAQVLQAALHNTLRQLVRYEVGDTIGRWHLDVTVHKLLATYFPAAEVQRFEASRQWADALAPVAAPLALVRATLAIVGTIGSALLLLTWRTDRRIAGLAAIVLVGVASNAFATGALSGPHDRYAARITWLVLVPPAIWALNAATRLRDKRPTDRSKHHYARNTD